MASKYRQRKLSRPAQVESGGYFPDLDIGLQNNYIYYSSLLVGNDARFERNREIGTQAANYLNNIKNTSLNPSFETNNISRAITLLYQAYQNERAKEAAWLSETCDALGIDPPNYNSKNIDYIEIIKTLNEVQKGADEAFNTIKHEAERWSNIDIERVLNSKKLQQHYESLAKRMERKGIAVDKNGRTPADYHKLAEDLYWGTKGNAGRPNDQKQLSTVAKVLGDIDMRANKLFTGSGRSLAAKVEKILIPYLIKNIKINNNGDIYFNLAKIQDIVRQLLMWIVEQIVQDDLNFKYNGNSNLSTNFLTANSGQKESIINEKINSLGEEALTQKANELLRTNGYYDIINAQLPAPSETQEQLLKNTKEMNDKAEKILRKIIRNLAESKEEQEAYIAYRKSQSKKYNRTSVSANSKEFQRWLEERYKLREQLSGAAIEEAITSSIRQRYYYSEEHSVDEFTTQFLKAHMNGNGVFRPTGNPKADVVAGYFNYEIEFNRDKVRKKRAITEQLQNSITAARKSMDKIVQDAYNHTGNIPEEMKILRTASVEDYTHNAQAFELIRERQLQQLTQLAEEVKKQKAVVQQIMTKYNVLTTIKDQSGLLDTLIPGTKLRERGIGFSGGAMGTNDNGLSVIDNIVALGKKGLAVDSNDVEWLKFALLNSGLGLLGYKNRSSLENYISLFASYLMFDDAQNIVSDAINNRAEEIGKQHSVQEIHLYLINGIYMPQSYILYELYNKMQQAINDGTFGKRNLSEGTVRAQIYSYNVGSGYPGNTESDWRREAATAASTVKVKMYFLMNFSDLVKQLSERIGGL